MWIDDQLENDSEWFEIGINDLISMINWQMNDRCTSYYFIIQRLLLTGNETN